MAVRLSALPKHLPPVAHLHKANFVLPGSMTDIEIFHVLQQITGMDRPEIKKEYGQRFQYREWYTLRNDHGAVLIAVYTSGVGRFKDTTAISVNGQCFEDWCHPSHNPMTPDPVALCRYVLDHNGWFTRIDLAKNDYRRVIDWQELVHCADKAHFRDRLVIKLNKTKPPIFLRQEGESVYFGSSKSATQVLGYVKHDQELTKFPWIRFEVKVRGRAQCNHIAQLMLVGRDLVEITSGVLAYLLDFKEPGIKLKNKRETCRWWSQFVGSEKIKLVPDKANEEPDIYF